MQARPQALNLETPVPDVAEFTPQDVIRFWFEEIDPKQWWTTEPAFDQTVAARFGELHLQAAQGALFGWRTESPGRLAEIIVLDQFSRNIFRNQPRAFAQDPMALALAQEAIGVKADEALAPHQRSFLYLPFMHSESAVIHVQAERLYRMLGAEGNYKFELGHKAIIDRFGRYPHRNAILGRVSSADEIEFLGQPGSHF